MLPFISLLSIITIISMLAKASSYFIKKNYGEKSIPNSLNKKILIPITLSIICTLIYLSFNQFEILYSKKTFLILMHFVNILLIVSVGYFFYRLASFIENIILHIFEKQHYKDLTFRSIKTKIKVLGDILNFLILFIIIISILLTFDQFRALGNTLLTTAGIATVIIGFAAQKSLGSLFSGLQIALTQPIKIDDNVVIEGRSGTVSQINLTNVFISTWDEKKLIVPINYFIENIVENWTQISQEATAIIKIFCDYTIPIDDLRNYFTTTLVNHHLWDKRSYNFLITNANEHGIEIRASMSAKNPKDAFIIECEIREQLIQYIAKNFPHCFPNTRVQIPNINSNT